MICTSARKKTLPNRLVNSVIGSSKAREGLVDSRLLSRLPSRFSGNFVYRYKTLGLWSKRNVVVTIRSVYAIIEAQGSRKSFAQKPSIVIPLLGVVVKEMSNSRLCIISQVLGKRRNFVLEAMNRDVLLVLKALIIKISQETLVQLEDFEKVVTLGKGHFGRVHLARHVATGNFLALKQVKTTKKAKTYYDERVILEKLTLDSKINISPNLIYAFKQDEDLYLAMEACTGGDLWGLIRKHKKLDEASVRFIAAELVKGVQQIHNHAIVHRDIKLENVMFDSHGHVKLVDFGLAKELTKVSEKSSRFSRSFSICGTNYYMPPEMLKGMGHSLGIDWWQVGCLIYELFVGKPAFYARTEAKVHSLILSGNPIAFPKDVESSMSSGAKDLIISLLTREPADRLGFLGAEDVLRHSFFSGVDWESIENRTFFPETGILVATETKKENADDAKGENVPLEINSVMSHFPDATDLDGTPLSEKRTVDLPQWPSDASLSTMSLKHSSVSLPIRKRSSSSFSTPSADILEGHFVGYNYVNEQNSHVLVHV